MLKIQLLGIGCKKSRALKANLHAALEHLPFKVEVEEVKEVGDIVRYQIRSAPALLINGEIVCEGEVLDKTHLQKLLKVYQIKDKGIREVLLPTDFSDTATNAFKFAQDYFDPAEGVVLKLIHVYHPAFENPYSSSFPDATMREAQQRKLIVFAQSAEKGGSQGNVLTASNVQLEAVVGFPTEEIFKASLYADLIIMGTTGDGNWLEKVFGSVSSSIAKQALCPVLLIPPGAKYQGFHHIVFANSTATPNPKLIEQMRFFTHNETSNVDFVHVEQRTVGTYEVKRILYDKAAHVKTRIVHLSCKNTLHGLTTYANTQKADLIVMTTRHRSFLNDIFHHSLTKEMILRSNIPILVLPAEL